MKIKHPIENLYLDVKIYFDEETNLRIYNFKGINYPILK
jgi:hypothetical protein